MQCRPEYRDQMMESWTRLQASTRRTDNGCLSDTQLAGVTDECWFNCAAQRRDEAARRRRT
jgi:hypothetical protein